MPTAARTRALVLGGGGVVGIAWETGFLAGLADRGVDALDVDLVVGTSAGAAVGAQAMSSMPLAQLLARQLDPSFGLEPRIDDVDMGALAETFGRIMADGQDAEAARRRLGAMALEHDRVAEAERRAIIAARLPGHDWPERRLWLTAIDAASGKLTVFDRDSGVPLIDAVAASCAIPVVWPAVTIDGRRYIDGGLRSCINADLARDHDRILVIEPFVLPEMSDVVPLDPARSLVVRLDEASIRAVGDDPLDPDARPACARAGYEQGARSADRIRHFMEAAGA
jgi:NTE family protein